MGLWSKGHPRGYLVTDGEDPILFLPPADVITQGVPSSTVLTFVQESTEHLLDEVLNRWPPSPVSSGRWRDRVAQRFDAASRIMRAASEHLPKAAYPADAVRRDPVQGALACIRSARDIASQLRVPVTDVVVAPSRREGNATTPRAQEDRLEDRLSKLQAGSGGSIEGLYLHGSIATRGTTGFSDLDGLVLLAFPAERDAALLAGAARSVSRSTRLLLMRDALQHHGWTIASPSLLDAFPETMLPLATLDEGVAVFGPSPLTIRRFRSRIIARRKLWSMVQVFRALRQTGAGGRLSSLHEEKMLLSQFMLLPALYAQATNRYVSKRASFSLVRAELPAIPWEPMEDATAIRAGWCQPAYGKTWDRLGAVLGTWEAQVIWRKASGKDRDVSTSRRVPDQLIDSMAAFAETLLQAAETANVTEADT